jgi:ATP-dependent RNA helicase MSS116, mitochondrial
MCTSHDICQPLCHDSVKKCFYQKFLDMGLDRHLAITTKLLLFTPLTSSLNLSVLPSSLRCCQLPLIMFRPGATGKLLRQSRAVRSASFQVNSSLRASTSSIQCSARLPSSTVSSLRTFTSFPRLSQYAATATAPAPDVDEIKHASPEMTKFSELAEANIIHPKIVDNIGRMGIHTMTDVQRMTINECLDGSDVIAQARTGTGKTIAFLMPIIQRLMHDRTLTGLRPTIEDTRAVIVSPTRELAEQIGAEAKKVCANTHVQIQTAVGGTAKRQNLADMRRQGCHILVATPGRLKDLLSDRYSGVTLNKISTFVLDEADRLLDIGFAPDIAEIQTYMPDIRQKDRQTLMFSATVPKTVVDLVRQTLKPDFKFVRTVDPDEAPTHERIPQNVVYLPGLQNQVPVIAEIAMNAIKAHREDPENNLPFKAIIFMNSKNEVALTKQWLSNMGPSGGRGSTPRGDHPLGNTRILEMSSGLSQQQRTFNSQIFRQSESAILVASDVVARGMDFPNVSHVIQTGLPGTIEAYIHRVGRTGRAGKQGQGWLLLQKDDRREWEHSFAHALHLKEDHSLATADLDMTRGGQIPASIAQLMEHVENGIRAVPYALKQDTFTSMVGPLRSSGTKRSPQQVVDMLIHLSRYGWGLETPPPVRYAWAAKMGMSGCHGLEYDQAGMGRAMHGGPPPQVRGLNQGRTGFNDRDPFGMGGGAGVGVQRAGAGGDGMFGGRGGNDAFGSRGGYGGDRRGGGGDYFERRSRR